MKYVIVGGVAGGATAAARIRRLDEKATIVVFERGEHISYANCSLPYYLGGVIADRDNLFVQNPEKFHAFFHVDVRTLTGSGGDRSRQETGSLDQAPGWADRLGELGQTSAKPRC